MTETWTANDERTAILKIVAEMKLEPSVRENWVTWSWEEIAVYNMGRLRQAIIQAIEKRGKK